MKHPLYPVPRPTLTQNLSLLQVASVRKTTVLDVMRRLLQVRVHTRRWTSLLTHTCTYICSHGTIELFLKKRSLE